MDSRIPVTRTKILVPRRRAELLSRQRLLDLLYELLDDQLIIVTAPAGYGKTSLLIDFIHFANWPVCWFALDPLDRDPQRFIAHFIASLNLRYPAFGKSSMAALDSTTQDNMNLDSLLSVIINDIYENITEHFIFILDDFHLVEDSKPVNYFINRFVQDIDENCHLIISSRKLLGLPDLPLLVARNLVGGLSFTELAFQPEEIQRLLQVNYNMKITDAEAVELGQATEGWITGLLLSTQLVGGEIADRLRVARASGVGLYEYLAQQVLERQDADVQDFLLRTSLLEEFDAAMCVEVIGPALGLAGDWPGMMNTALRSNLFILPVGEEGLFLRYHHLFRDFLQARMERQRPAEAEKIRIYQAEYAIRQGEWERAYAVYQKLGKPEAIPDLITLAGKSMVARGRLATLAEWLEALPARVLDDHPALLSLQGVVEGSRGDTRGSQALLDRAVTALQARHAYGPLANTLARRSVIRRFVGEYDLALEDADAALELTKTGRDAETADSLADALYAKGMALFYLGRVSEAQDFLNRATEAYQVAGDEQTLPNLMMDIGMVFKALGQYADAEKAYLKALAFYQAAGNLVWQANLLNNLGVLQHLLGNYEMAVSSLEKAIQYAETGGYPRLKAYALASIGDLYRDLEARREAAEAYKQARQTALQVNERYLLFCLDLSEADLASSQGNPGKAQELLRSAQAIADVGGSNSDLHLCRLGWAGLALAIGKYQEALPELNRAVEFYDREGYRAEGTRAHLYLAAACFETGDRDGALAHLERLAPLMTEEKPLNFLLVAVKEISSSLERMQEDASLAGLARRLDELISAFDRQQMPTIRRLLRRKNLVIPFAGPKLMIYALGKSLVKVADQAVSNFEWRTQAARELFFLLLIYPEGFTKEEIGELFWPGFSPSDLRLRFKNVMYRLRHAVGKEVVLFKEEIYRFNRLLDYEYDVDNFSREIQQAQAVREPEAKIAHLQAALKIYKGAFLEGISAQWVHSERLRLSQMHIDGLLTLAELHLTRGQNNSALSSCQSILKEEACHEAAHRLAMRTYAAMGNRVLLVRQYEQCRRALEEEIHTAPSVQTQALYEELLR